MAYKISPEIQILCQKRTSIPQRGPHFFGADRLADLTYAGFGDWAGSTPEDVTSIGTGASWSAQPSFTDLIGVDFIRFTKDGRVHFGAGQPQDGTQGEERDLAGFVLAGREAILDAKIGTNGNDFTDTFTDNHWQALSGTWFTVFPPEPPQRCCIFNTGADVTARAKTIGDLPANRSFGVPLYFSGANPTGPLAGFRLSWGGEAWAIVLRHNLHPTIEKKIGGVWKILKTLTQAPTMNLHGGRVNIALRRYAGRLVVTINGAHYWVLDTALAGANKPREVAWGAGPLMVTAYNVHARMGLSVWKWSDSGGRPFRGTIGRTWKRSSYLAPSPVFSVVTGGYKRAGVNIIIDATSPAGKVEYIAHLTASPDGIDTPLLNQVMLRSVPAWTSPSTGTLDIAPALTAATISKALPPATAGDEAVVDVDRLLLNGLAGDWQDYTQSYCPVTIKIRWLYSDHSRSAWQIPFKGYIMSPRPSSDAYNSQPLTLTCRSSIVRLQKPAATVDHRHPPLDFWFATLGTPLPGVAEPDINFYGYQAVKEILRMFLGDDAADTLNGNGNGGRFLPRSHYPLLTSKLDACGYYELLTLAAGANYETVPPTKSGFWFPPPYREDAWYWITEKIGKDDKAICYEGWPDNDATVAPVLLYGRRLNLISRRSRARVADAEYISGDLNRLISSAEVETRPEKDVNRILAMAQPLRGGAEALAPSMVTFESQLPAGDANAAIHTWERTEIIADDINAIPGAAQAIAQQTIALLRGSERAWPTLEFIGDANMQFGDAILIAMSANSSGAGLLLDGKTFRVEPVKHSITRGEATEFKTRVGLRPLTSQERRALSI